MDLRAQFKRAPSRLLGMTQKLRISFWKPREDTEKAEQGQVALAKGNLGQQPGTTDKAASDCMRQGPVCLDPFPWEARCGVTSQS